MGVTSEWPEARPVLLGGTDVNPLLNKSRLKISDVFARRKAKEIAHLCENLRTIMATFGSEVCTPCLLH
jgi:hypothetical protein